MEWLTAVRQDWMEEAQGGELPGLRTLVVDPDAFFRERAETTSLRGPTAVVLTAGVAGFIGSIPVLGATAAAMPDEFGGFVWLVAAVSAAGSLLASLVAWGLYAGSFHVLSAWFFGSASSIRTTLALTGWGFLPRVPEALLSGAVSVVLFSGTTIPDDPAAARAAVAAARQDPLFVGAGLLGLIFLAWRGALWTFAMRHGRSLSLRRAALVVAGPVLVTLALSLRALFVPF